jgi:RNA polymerase sigma factor (sigma-70 family)
MEPMTPEEQRLLLKHAGLIWDVVRAMPRSVLRRVEPEDLFQQAVPHFLRLLRLYDPDKSSMAHWIISNLRRSLFTHLKCRGFGGGIVPVAGSAAKPWRAMPDALPEFYDVPSTDPEPEFVYAETAARLHEAIQQLPPADADLLHARYLDDETQDTGEIASRRGVSRQAIQQRLKRLYRILAEVPGLADA